MTHRPDPPQHLIPPVRQANTLEATFETLLRLIGVGVFPPETQLPPERELAAQLNVSRSTLRAVLQDLREHGCLEVRRGRYGGTFVTDAIPNLHRDTAADADEVEDILDFRELVEVEAVRRLARRGLTPEQRDDLSAALDRIEACPREQYRRLDSRLHLMLADFTGSRRLARAAVESRSEVNGLLDLIPQLPSNLDHTNEQHRAIVEAVSAGDPDAAAEAVREHLDGSRVLLRGFLLP